MSRITHCYIYVLPFLESLFLATSILNCWDGNGTESSFSVTLYHITRLEIDCLVILHCDRRKWEEGRRW